MLKFRLSLLFGTADDACRGSFGEVLKSISVASSWGASVEHSPFPHAFVSNAFPDPYYSDMLRHFPAADALVSNGEAGRGNQLQARFVFEIKEKYLNSLPEPQREFWSDFRAWILGEKLRASILNRFSEQIEKRFPQSRSTDFYGDAVLVEDHTTHSMGPHTDHPRKAVTCCFIFQAISHSLIWERQFSCRKTERLNAPD